jgi:maltose/moltooligosaccharide transporter
MAGSTDNAPKPAQPKFRIKQTFLIGLGFMSCMLAWAMYNFYFPRILAGQYVGDVAYRVGYFTGDSRLFWANLLMTVDNILAIFIQPYFGELSDRLESKYGRRSPFLLLGIPVAALSLFLMPFISFLPEFLIMLVGFITTLLLFNLAMAFYRAPVVALMPDLTPSVHRSMANVIINLMGGVGTAIGYVIAPLMGLIPAIKDSIVGYTNFMEQKFVVMDMAVFWTTALFMLVVLGLYMLFVKEIPTGKKFWHVGDRRIEFDPETLQIIQSRDIEVNTSVTGKEIKLKPVKRYSTIKELRALVKAKEKSAILALIAIFFWTAADDALGTNMSLWGAEYALLPDFFLVSLSIVMMVFVLIFGIPGAMMSKKKGRLWSMRTGLLLFIICHVGIIVSQELIRVGFFWPGFIATAVLFGVKALGGGLLGIVAITIIWQMAPKDKVGTYTGLYYLFKQAGSVIAPLAAGGILAVLTPWLGQTGVWVILMPFCLALSVAAYVTMARVKRGEVGDDLSAEEVAELERLYDGDA